MGKSIWEVLGFKKSSSNEKVKVLQNYRIHFRLNVKDKPMLGSIQGQATVTSDNEKNAEEYLRQNIYSDLNLEFPYDTKAILTEAREDSNTTIR